MSILTVVAVLLVAARYGPIPGVVAGFANTAFWLAESAYDGNHWTLSEWEESLFPMAAIMAVAGCVGYLVKTNEAIHQRAHKLATEIAAEKAEAQRQAVVSEKLRSLGTLVAGVAHEINNPLTYIRWNAESNLEDLTILQEGSMSRDEQSRMFETLARRERILLDGVSQIAHVTTSLRLIAKPGTGKREPQCLATLTDAILAVATTRLAPEIDIHREYEAQALATANDQEICQVLLNLVLNAGDAFREKPEGARLILRTFDLPDAGLTAVEVEDNGCGITPEAQADIFTPFFTTKAEGMGIGLSLSRRIAEAHGGTLTFVTAPGQGTIFRLTLPIHGDPARSLTTRAEARTLTLHGPEGPSAEARRETQVLSSDKQGSGAGP